MIDFNYSVTELDQRASGQIIVSDYTELDLTAATGDITITDYLEMIEAAATGTIQIDDYSLLALATVTVDSVAYVEGTDWTAGTSNDATATSLASAIDAGAQGASATTDTVTVTAATAGSAGNAIDTTTDASSGITLSGATLEGGQDHASITVDSVTYVQGTDFNAATDEDTTASNLATAVDTGAQGASATGAIVTVTAATAGSAGNLIGTTSSAGIGFTIDAATLLGGIDAGVITLQGTAKTEGTDWDAETSNDVTATNLATALDAIAGFTASATDNVVTVYFETPGAAGNAKTLVTSDATNLAVSGATLADGVDETISDIFSFDTADDIDNLEVILNVTAITGTNPTLDITPQYSLDKEAWFDHATVFTQVTAATSEALDLSFTGLFARFKVELGGTNTLPTFKISAIVK